MTQPTQTAEQAAAEQAAAEQAAAEQAAAEQRSRRRGQPSPDEEAASVSVSVLDVVEFDHHDPILGGSHRDLGVVVGVDEHGVDVIPLAGHRVRANADEVRRLTVGDDV